MWYYTHSGQQAGPISNEELKALVASGQLPDSSLAWTEGMSDWTPISAIPALADTRTAGFPSPAPAPSAVQAEAPLNPYSAPTADMGQPDTLTHSGMNGLEEIIPGSQPLDIGACISRAFELTKRHFGMLLVIGIVMLAISVGVSIIMDLVDGALGWESVNLRNITGDPNVDDVIVGMSDQGSVLNRIVCGLVDLFLGLGIVRIGLNVVSGEAFTIGMLFSQGSRTFRAYIAQILFGLMVAVGLLLLIFPGIYLALRYGQYKNAIVDKDMGIFDAFSYSARITTENKLSLCGLFILCFLIVLAGAIALLVGLLFAIPLTTLASIVAYRWMQYGYASVQER